MNIYRSKDRLQLILLAANKLGQPILAERCMLTVLPEDYFKRDRVSGEQ